MIAYNKDENFLQKIDKIYLIVPSLQLITYALLNC